MATANRSNTQRSSRSRWKRRVLVGAALLLIAGALGLGGALTCRPAWYQPASIDYNHLEADKRAELDLENRISRKLNRGQPVEIELTEEQVNRWIAARDELWPGEVPSLDPFQRPQVSFLDGNRVRIAAQVRRGGMRSVVSITLGVAVAGDEVVLAGGRLRAGLLPAPRRLVSAVLRRAAPRLDVSEDALRAGTIRLPAEGIWHNGRRRFRITNITIRAGEARVRMEPL